MISLRSIRNIATLFTVILSVTCLVATFNYSSTVRTHILGELDELTPEIIYVQYWDNLMPLSMVADDIQELKNYFGKDLMIAPMLIRSDSTKDLNGKTLSLTYVQTTSALFNILGVSVTPEFNTYLWEQEETPKCLIAKAIVPKLFASSSPLGASIFLLDEYQLIQGIFECNDKLLGIQWNKTILSHFNLVGESGAKDSVRLIIRLPDISTKIETITQVLMRTKNKKNFHIQHFNNMIERKNNIVTTVEFLTETISFIILLMSTIGCMNIFFISVNERIREIGLRRALGFRTYEIVAMVMRDCYFFMGVGTLLGLLGGWLFTQYLFNAILATLPDYTNWQFSIHSSAIIKTLVFLFISSSFSGIFPAIRASRIEPSKALRE